MRTATDPQHDLIPLSEPERWDAALAEVPHAHAHTWGFCRAVQLTSGLPTYLYCYERGPVRVVCPLSERQFQGGTDVVTPYGFAGFASAGPKEEFPADWAEFARSRGWVCGYIALHPLLSGAAGFPPEDVHVHNRLYVMDLRGSNEELIGRLSRNRRRQLREWPSVAPRLNRNRQELTDFLVTTYADFIARKGGGHATRFTPETMEEIAGLDDVLMVGAGGEGPIEAVAVFGHTSSCGESLFSVSVPGGERHAVHLTWAAVEWLRALEVESFNLGGGIRQGDEVAEFKRRFGAVSYPLVSLRQVYLASEYERLCHESGVSPTDRAGYFPAYRA